MGASHCPGETRPSEVGIGFGFANFDFTTSADLVSEVGMLLRESLCDSQRIVQKAAEV